MPAKRRVSRFTDAQVTRIRPEEKRFIVWGDRGLGLRVTPKGSKSWIYTFRFHGRSRMVTLGYCPPMMPGDARMAHLAAVGQRRSGIDPGTALVSARAAQRAELTVNELAEKFIELEAVPNTRPATSTEYARVLRNVIGPRWGRRLARDITRKDILALKDDIAIRHETPIMAARVLACVRRTFNWAVSREIIAVSPYTSIESPDRGTPRARILTYEEIGRLLRALRADVPAQVGYATAFAIRLVLVTGCRPGEAAGLRWKEIDETGRWWLLPAERTKTGVPHRIPLTSAALEIIGEARTRLPRGACVFPADRSPGPIEAKRLNRVVADSLSRWGFDADAHWTTHDLRRTCASNLASMQVPVAVVERILGHSAAKLTRTYQVYGYDIEAREALERWADRLREIEAAPAEEAIASRRARK